MNVNICFHGVGVCGEEREPGESRYWMAEDVFLGVLDRIAGNERVRLSFDDGNASDIVTGLPALSERGLQAQFFALAGRLEDPASLSPTDLRELRSAGMAIGSHGWEHIPWRGLDESSVRRELVDARIALAEASGGEISDAALPLGRYDRRLLGRLHSYRYRTVFTSDRFPARPASWLQARYSVTARDTPDSVAAIVAHRLSLADARNLTASLVKRLR